MARPSLGFNTVCHIGLVWASIAQRLRPKHDPKPRPSPPPLLFQHAPIHVLRRSKSNTILLAGLSGSGKTVLFYQLRDGSPHLGTVTSMEPNDGTFVLHSELEKESFLSWIVWTSYQTAEQLLSRDKLRTSRSAISTADIANDFTLGIPGEGFAFCQCRNKVTVAESSGLTGEVSQVEQFIRELVKP
ncbi:signal recognition particle receptor [Musa troglodytarum]|uniref:Signal recognition particle receptor subunit beta n=1 Tax=Musa troglodytarum TaxID=320322 RepID=A0A9E7JUL1_9LILI|nr:signal recognition particle receptor [Musa troglodytarum]